jgi:hypothetical protein
MFGDEPMKHLKESNRFFGRNESGNMAKKIIKLFKHDYNN